MKEKLKNKKVVYTIIGIVSILLVALALTYAYWLLTKEQTGENVISSACLDIEITGEKNDIELGSQYPIADSEGEKLTPYEFTVTNKCDSAVDYQIALETMPNDDGKETLSASALKVMLDSSAAKTLDKYKSVDTTITDATASNKLGSGTLAATGETGASATHKVRIWIDANAPIGEMNRTFTGKVSVTIGQGIVKSDTMKNLMLASAGGEDKVDTLVNEKSDQITSSGSTYVNLNNKYYWGTTYSVESDRYKLDGDIVQATTAECRNGLKADGTEITCGQYRSSSQSTTITITRVISLTSEKGDNYIESEEITYKNDYEVLNTGIHKAEDDKGTSYFYRGNVQNNYVKFGTFAEDSMYNYKNVGSSNGEFTFNTIARCYYNIDLGAGGTGCEATDAQAKAGDAMYWRIMRINGDGTIRMVLDGPKAYSNYSSPYGVIGYSNFSSNGSSYTSSNIKTILDNWYDKNLKGKYDDYIADATFCNDMSGNAAARLSSYAVSLNCADEYKLSVSNGKLLHPIGIPTADEYVMLDNGVSNSYFKGTGDAFWWTMTAYDDELSYATYFNSTLFAGGLNDYREYTGARPVINLRADVEFTGNGTKTSPYEVVMN